MPFPETPRVEFAKNTLKQVIFQVRFPTILRISASQPADFQECLRDHYPLYDQQTPGLGLPSEFARLVQQLGIDQKLSQPATHNFHTTDRKRSVGLTQDFISVTTNSYVRWTAFRGEIEAALKALTDIYKPKFYRRIGLRYQNLIDREDLGLADKDWSDLINPSLLGILGTPGAGDAVEETSTDVVFGLNEGKARLRHGLQELHDRKVYQIDVDFFLENEGDDLNVLTLLDTYNRSIGNLFRWAISPELKEALRQHDDVPRPANGGEL